ncbi:MAG: DUF2298 domain-containing protein [Patescibacteria group bacterium]
MQWLIDTLTWYFYMLILGVIFLPVANKIFGKNVDKGYAFAKAIGIIALSYIFLSLGILRLLPFGRAQIMIVMLVVGLLLYRKQIFQGKFNLSEFIKKNTESIKWAIVIEVLFLASLLFWTFVRGQEPNIRGLEKFMDYGFMQSISRSTYMPPIDMWYSADTEVRPKGYFINYYYFGHLGGAILTKLTDVPSEVGYNLILSNLFALGMTMSFAIVVNLLRLVEQLFHNGKKKMMDRSLALFGLLGAFLVNFAGNWHMIYIFTKGYPNESPVPPWEVLPDLKAMGTVIAAKFPNVIGALAEYSKYWYPNATRFIPNTIHEFPSYSYVVADLHGHVFDIPFVLLSLSLVFFVFLPAVVERWNKRLGYYVDHQAEHQIEHNTEEAAFKSAIKNTFGENAISKFAIKCIEAKAHWTFLMAFMAAVHYMTNAFNGPIYILLFAFVLVALHWLTMELVLNLAILGFGFFYFSAPFSLFFEPFVSGVGVNCGFPLVQSMVKADETAKKIGPFLFEKGNCQISAPYQLFLLWGLFWFVGLILTLVIFLSKRFIKVSQNHHEVVQVKKTIVPDFAILGIFLFGTMLIIIPEFFYIKDIYPTHFRANTMFKLGYQAYIMMSLMIPYVLWRVRELPLVFKNARRNMTVALVAGVLLVSPYMFFAIQSYYGDLTRPVKLDGIAWLKTEMSDVADIVDFFNTRVQGQPVILEAQGDSYTDYNVISAYTGLPTVAGWWVHEWLWRGNADIVGKRIPFIESIYRSDDIDETRAYLRKFNVRYVVISSNERKKYEVDKLKINEKKFQKLGHEVFRSGDGKGVVYEIN